MPKEYTHCVKGYVKKGRSLKDAKRICAGMYWNRHHMTVKQAHARGIEEVSEASLLDGLPSEEELTVAEQTLLTAMYPLEILEEGSPEEHKPFRYRGVALVDNAFSANGRYYSLEFNNTAMDRTNAAIAAGEVVTVYGRHGQAIGGFLSGPVYLPIGRIDKLFRESSFVKYDATLADTESGVDAAVLIRDKFVKGSSIRAYDFESELVTIGERQVERMITAVLAGIDLADNPGIPGAGIVQVLESAPQYTEVQEDNDMEFDWSKLTVDELKAKAPTIVEELLGGPKADLEKLTSDLGATAGQLAAATSTLAEHALKLAVLEAVQNPLTALAAKKLAAGVKSVQEITPELAATALEESRNEILVAAGINLKDGGSPKGPAGDVSAEISAERAEILRNTM